MEIKKINFGDEKSDKELFRYYLLNSMGYNYDDELEYPFETLEDAIKFSADYDNDDFEPFNLSLIILHRKGNGMIGKKEINMGKLPNKLNKTVNYYVIGQEDNDNLKVIINYSYAYNLNLEKALNEINLEELSNSNQLGAYKIIVFINEDKTLDYTAELVIPINNKKRIRSIKE